jgi:general secretion pathway protein A
MYLSFYELKEKPFNATPDPNFLHLTPGHREALSQLVYGVQESRGFIVLTGPVGTGKTTLLQAFFRRCDGEVEIAFIPFSMLSFDEILTYMLNRLGVTETIDSRVQQLQTLHNLLIDRRRAGQKTVLVIDEAQNLDPMTLEQIRLLSNFESPTEKLLQILLVGQPELKAKLELPELHQLKQRIGLCCAIPSLTLDESREYIRHRLRIAGAKDVHLFTEDAERRIAKYTEGIPRLLNIVCDHCLLFGYADQQRNVDRRIVRQTIAYLDEARRPKSLGQGISRWYMSGVLRWSCVVLIAGLLGWVALRFLPAEELAGITHRLEEHLSALGSSAHHVLSSLRTSFREMLPK